MPASLLVRPFPSRQAALFLIAILLPCGLLVILTLRMLVQDRELAEKRMADERQRLVAGARQSLLERVERLRRSINPGDQRPLPAEVAVVARVTNGRLAFPWESGEAMAAAGAALEAPAFRALLQRGTELEFGARRFDAAAAEYERASRAAALPVQRAQAMLFAARAFAKAGRGADAARITRSLLAVPPGVVDEQGIPIVLYAARLLADSPQPLATEASLVPAIRQVVSSAATGPAALYMARDVARRTKGAGEIATAIDERARDVEQALQLARALPSLGQPVATGGDPVWSPFGPAERLWLVSVNEAREGAVMTAVRAGPVLEGIHDHVMVAHASDGEPLLPNFPGLRATTAPAALALVAADSRRQRPFYLAALAVVVSITLAGGYLFWRDVQREIRVADLRSQFVSSVSHELKTPLTAIRMFAETLLMRRSTPAEVQHEYLDTIVNESERLTRLLNNVLDFSRIESGNRNYRLEPHALGPVVRSAAKTMQYPFAQQGFDLRVAVDDDVAPVAADPDAIQQAVLNLLSNAMKYSGDARTIDMSLTQDGANAVIAVTDRGVGIPLAEQSLIFEKFYRIRDKATDRIAGTGLGLTLVDHVARAHGGRVLVQSAPGEGSTFKLLLPVT